MDKDRWLSLIFKGITVQPKILTLTIIIYIYNINYNYLYL